MKHLDAITKLLSLLMLPNKFVSLNYIKKVS